MWSIISRSADSCCTILATAATCWWREDDEDDWDEDIEPNVLLARKQREAAGIGSAPVIVVAGLTPALPAVNNGQEMKEMKEVKQNIPVAISAADRLEREQMKAQRAATKAARRLQRMKARLEREKAAKQSIAKNAAITPIVIPLRPSVPTVVASIPDAPPLTIETPAAHPHRFSDAPPGIPFHFITVGVRFNI
jgi:hypothetical protein